DEGDRFGMIQLHAAREPLPGEFAGGEDQELVDFAGGQMHGPLVMPHGHGRSKERRCRRECSQFAPPTPFCKKAGSPFPMRPGAETLTIDGARRLLPSPRGVAGVLLDEGAIGGKTAMNVEKLVERIRAEFDEMPGMV